VHIHAEEDREHTVSRMLMCVSTESRFINDISLSKNESSTQAKHEYNITILDIDDFE